MSASLLEIVGESPLQAMEAIIENMVANEVFVPTQVATVLANERQLARCYSSSRARRWGQALMSLGGYIVKGILLKRGRRAHAIRNADGIFNMVRPGYYTMAIAISPRPPQPPQPPQQPLPMTDDIAAASSIFLAIQNTPSPIGNLLPQLEDQVAAEQATVETSELPLQDRIQFFERTATNNEEQQFEDEMAKTKLASIWGRQKTSRRRRRKR